MTRGFVNFEGVELRLLLFFLGPLFVGRCHMIHRDVKCSTTPLGSNFYGRNIRVLQCKSLDIYYNHRNASRSLAPPQQTQEGDTVWLLRTGGLTLPHSFGTKWRTCAQLYSLRELLKNSGGRVPGTAENTRNNARLKNSGKKKDIKDAVR